MPAPLIYYCLCIAFAIANAGRVLRNGLRDMPARCGVTSGDLDAFDAAVAGKTEGEEAKT